MLGSLTVAAPPCTHSAASPAAYKIAALHDSLTSKLSGKDFHTMELSNKTARQLYMEIKERPARRRFGFGRKPALVNLDLQKAYTAVGEFATAYETDPNQLNYVNELAALARAKG